MLTPAPVKAQVKYLTMHSIYFSWSYSTVFPVPAKAKENT
jgi:hypothetical protein